MDPAVAEQAVDIIDGMNRAAYSSYALLLEIGVAKEVARSVLPVSMYTQFYWTINARSLMNFLSLRLDENAQAEIREYAKKVEKYFAEVMPVTYQAWIDNGRVAP